MLLVPLPHTALMMLSQVTIITCSPQDSVLKPQNGNANQMKQAKQRRD